MTFHDRLNPDPRHIPDNVIPFDRAERRPAQKWWERAKSGELYGTDAEGNARVKEMTGYFGGDAA